jgi:hypothetical protein
MKIKITAEQLVAAHDIFAEDKEFVEIEPGNGGNLNIYPEGDESEVMIVAENGDIL